MQQLECSSMWSQMYYSNAPKNIERYLWIVKNRTANVIFGETSLIFGTLSNSGKGKAGNTFYQCKYEQRESISPLLWHV